MTQRIHAVLDPAFDGDPTRKAKLREFVVNRFHVENLNETRYHRLGIFSGDVEAGLVEELKGVEGFQSVSVDEAVYVS